MITLFADFIYMLVKLTIIKRLKVLKLTNSFDILKALNKHNVKHHSDTACVN